MLVALVDVGIQVLKDSAVIEGAAEPLGEVKFADMGIGRGIVDGTRLLWLWAQ